MATTLDIITRACRRIRIVGIMDSPPAEIASHALAAFNDMIAAYEADSLNTVTRTFTGNTTSGSYKITGIEHALDEVYSTFDIALNANISGTGIATGATVVKIDSSDELTMSLAATASGTGVSITFNVVPFDDSLTEAFVSVLAVRLAEDFGATVGPVLARDAKRGQAQIDAAFLHIPTQNVLDKALFRMPSGRYYDGVGTLGDDV